MKVSGNIKKMQVNLAAPVEYALPVGDRRVPLNEHIGKTLSMVFSGQIVCVACGRKTNKSFSQGYCFPCMRSLAECDLCILRPEQCHYAEGTCRDEQWAKDHCMQPHIVYLAVSSGLKVGITRKPQIPTRWIDQGAVQALPIFEVKNRYVSGLLEVILKAHVSDRTDWRRMLKGAPPPLDLTARAHELITNCDTEISRLATQLGAGSVTPLHQQKIVSIEYPVRVYPEEVKALNFDKNPEVSGELLGIKGQYLILDSGVINMRKFSGYDICLDLDLIG